jgi:hypothetical protein
MDRIMARQWRRTGIERPFAPVIESIGGRTCGPAGGGEDAGVPWSLAV